MNPTRNDTDTETFSEAAESWRSDAAEAVGEARRDAERFLRQLPYAMLGSLTIGARRTRESARRLFELPGDLLDRTRHAPAELRERYLERAEAGHELIDRVRGRKGVRRARRSAQDARAAAKGAATSTRRAARAAARAVVDAADAIEPTDTRPYEERTVDELYQLAAEREIDGRSQMNKKQLIAALRDER